MFEAHGFPASEYKHMRRLTRHLRPKLDLGGLQGPESKESKEDIELQTIMKDLKDSRHINAVKQMILSPRDRGGLV